MTGGKLAFCVALLWQSIVVSASWADVAKPKYGPQGSPKAVPLVFAPEYFRSPRHPAPDFWALIGFYVPQFNEAACSTASAAMVVNAARAKLPKTAEDKVISQPELLERVKVEEWKQRVSPEGFKGEHGMTLVQFGRAMEAVLKAYGFPHASVKVFHVESTFHLSKGAVVNALRENEASSKNFIVANFNQRELTDDADVGHFAPVAAFDEERQRVLILDPDREYYEPYWVSVDSFVAGMATQDKSAQAHRGYAVIRLEK